MKDWKVNNSLIMEAISKVSYIALDGGHLPAENIRPMEYISQDYFIIKATNFLLINYN
jgi:hypothetical protein